MTHKTNNKLQKNQQNQHTKEKEIKTAEYIARVDQPNHPNT